MGKKLAVLFAAAALSIAMGAPAFARSEVSSGPSGAHRGSGVAPNPDAATLSVNCGQKPAAPLASNILLFDSDRTGNYEIFAVSKATQQTWQLTCNSTWDSWWARISPDRTQVLFYRTPRGPGHDEDYTRTNLWMMDLTQPLSQEPTNPRLVRAAGAGGWEVQGHAEWHPSPPIKQLVMFGGTAGSPQIFVTDLGANVIRQVTNRRARNIDPSWSPDGSQITFIGCPKAACLPKDFEVYTIPAFAELGVGTRLTTNKVQDNDPYYSPDGRQIAWMKKEVAGGLLTRWNIWVMNTDGKNPIKLTNDQISATPYWSRTDGGIYFHQKPNVSSKFGIWVYSPVTKQFGSVVVDPSSNNEYPSI